MTSSHTRVLVTGAAGRTGRYITLLLGNRAKALIRHAGQSEAALATGAEVVTGDLILSGPGERASWLAGCEALIFAAGAGAGANPDALDHLATVNLIEAAENAGVNRFILISSMGTPYPEQMPPMLKPFLLAKRKAEIRLEASPLSYTIIRPGGLSDTPGSGRVNLAPQLPKMGIIARQDVAGTAVLSLDNEATFGKSFDVIEGTMPIADALSRLA